MKKIDMIQKKLTAILIKAQSEQRLSKEDIHFLLRLREKKHVDRIFNIARELRTKYHENHIFLYGFLYISTFCNNNCNFCFYRAPNSSFHRYRKKNAEAIKAASEMASSGVHLIDLTFGEDPSLFKENRKFKSLLELIEKIKKNTDLPIMISPGRIPEFTLDYLSRAGVNWFACYQETHNPNLFKQLRPGQNFQKRLNIKMKARQKGFKIEEGILIGVGETTEDIIHSIEVMETLQPDQVRVMSFVPQPNTPMSHFPKPDLLKELLTIAVLRIIFPSTHIPASLDIQGIQGLKARLEAGADVISSIVPPKIGLSGVANPSLDINEARRTVQHVLPILNECNLKPAPAWGKITESKPTV